MRNNYLPILFIAFLPVIAALGFDLYLLYENPDNGFMFSTLGFAWTRYSPETFAQAVKTLDPEIWAVINFLLAQKTVLLAIVFFICVYGLLIVVKTLGSILKPKKKGPLQIPGRRKATPFKYKNKKRY